jgi:hypothetical protein
LDNQVTFSTKLRSHCSSLLEQVTSPDASDLNIWNAVASLLVACDPSNVPKPPKNYNSTHTEADTLFLRKLRENWTSDYLPESLEALQDMIRDNESRRDSASLFYAKTLIFVQSSGMGKSRLADAFGKDCPMVNFVLREEGTFGYPPTDSEVLSFMRKRPSEDHQKKIRDTPTRKRISSMRISEEDMKQIKNSPGLGKLKSIVPESSRPKEVMESSPEPEKEYQSSQIPETVDEKFLESMVTAVWNHSIAVGLLQASFEICKLRPLFITTKAQVLIQNNVRHSQYVGRTTKF